MDASKPENQSYIARLQVSGILEGFFSEPLCDMIYQGRPLVLGQAARIVLANLEKDTNQEVAFRGLVDPLPADWPASAHAMPATFQTLQFTSSLSETYARYFKPHSHFSAIGVCATELMVSLNEDRFRHLNPRLDLFQGSSITAYDPGSFLFELAAGDQTLVSVIMSGEVSVSDVVIGAAGQTVEEGRVE